MHRSKIHQNLNPGIVKKVYNIFVFVFFVTCLNAQNNPPVAVDDTIYISPGYDYKINVLKNDYDPDGDSIYLVGPSSLVEDDSCVLLALDFNDFSILNNQYKRYYYYISDDFPLITDPIPGLLHVYMQNAEFFDSLDINNISARFNCFDSHFWDLDDQSKFYVPKDNRTTAMFANSLWIAGYDQNEDLHFGMDCYKSHGYEFMYGPISEIYDSLYNVRWFYVWKLSREEVDYHQANWWKAGYEPIKDILTWPGNGDPEIGQASQITPYFDRNENGIYEPVIGDCPIIKGDQALFFVFNDVRSFYTQIDRNPLGIEIHAIAYAFDEPTDSALLNSVFLNYKIINRSDTAYHDVYVGQYSDYNIGWKWDDFMGCDVEDGFIYGYNADEFDEDDSSNPNDTVYNYGFHPPAMGIMILGGSKIEPDGIDNPKFDINNQPCDYSFNGLNFGDGIPDNERLGLTNFLTYITEDNICDDAAVLLYDVMQSKWIDGLLLYYGGFGHLTTNVVGPECRYLFPGSSDLVNWGTYGLWPNAGFNQSGKYWTEEYENNNPGDRKGVSSSGPFTFNPGDTVEFDVAFVWARDYEGTAWSSVELLKERCAYIKDKFENEEAFFSGIKNKTSESSKLLIYPNPGLDILHIQIPDHEHNYHLEIFNCHGMMIYEENVINQDILKINIQHLNSGFYHIRCISGNVVQKGTFIKL